MFNPLVVGNQNLASVVENRLKVSPKASEAELKKISSPWETLTAVVILLLATGLFFAGRVWWDETYYTAEDGLGYYLGLVGGVIMLMAYVYSMRKHFKVLRYIGSMSRWLRIHIAFGIIGPFMIILHTTFQFNSLNGTMAFFSMIAVMASGVMGRYLYSRVHFGLYGRKARFAELQQMFMSAEGENNTFLSSIPEIKDQLEALQKGLLMPPSSSWKAVQSLVRTRLSVHAMYRHLSRQMPTYLGPAAQQRRWDSSQVAYAVTRANSMLQEYLWALKKVAVFNAYDRLFTLWRMVHIPLLYLLFISGVLHVLAVHMY